VKCKTEKHTKYFAFNLSSLVFPPT